jgi:hypothetical protein
VSAARNEIREADFVHLAQIRMLDPVADGDTRAMSSFIQRTSAIEMSS